jgi:hypothetical protein
MTRSRSSKYGTTMPETQREKFVQTARELGCDEDPEAFKRIVKRIAKPKDRDIAERRVHNERRKD